MESQKSNMITILILFNDCDSFQYGMPSRKNQDYSIELDISSNQLKTLYDWLYSQNMIKHGDNIIYKIKETFLNDFQVQGKTIESILEDLEMLEEVKEEKTLMIECFQKRNTISSFSQDMMFEEEQTIVDKMPMRGMRSRNAVKLPKGGTLNTEDLRNKEKKDEQALSSNDQKSQIPKSTAFQIRMNGSNRLLEIAESSIGEYRIMGIIKNAFTERMYMQFYLKNEEKVFFDPHQQVIKLIFEKQNLNFSIISKNLFQLFLKSLKGLRALNLQFEEFDCFFDKELQQRRNVIKKQISQMVEASETYDVFSNLKTSWKVRKLSKKLIVEPNGKITVFGETEDSKDVFLLKEINQIIWNNASQTSNPQVSFTFKDERPLYEILFEQEASCKKFLKQAEDIIRQEKDQRRDMFIVKQSSNLKRKSRIIKQYEWFQIMGQQAAALQNDVYPNSLEVPNPDQLQLPKSQSGAQLPKSQSAVSATSSNEEREGKGGFNVIFSGDEKGQREEDVEWASENKVLFKVILIELNIERKRYLILNRETKTMSILKSSNKQVEMDIKFSQIVNIQRSMIDHRQIMIKIVSLENILLLTFSSVYKLLQFLEFQNFYSSIIPMHSQLGSLNEEFKQNEISLNRHPERLRILVVTYNMNRKIQNFQLEQFFSEPSTYDIIVFGGQEAKMTSKTSVIIEIANFLGKSRFLTVQTVQMWEMFLVGFIKLNHVPYLKNTQSSYKATGIGNFLGNKGGLQMSFKLYDYLFNFINVHLVHGAKRFEKRNEMMSSLIRQMRNQREEIDPDFIADYSFILGDLNYRMEGTYDEIMQQLDNIVEERKTHDQLYKSMNEYGKYPDYTEFEIGFMPTYKKNKFEEGYFNKKNQAPSYTDRILFKNNTTNPVHLQKYNSLDHIYGSDHRPVTLDMDLHIRPLQYLKLQSLIDPCKQMQQGVGIFKFKGLKLKKVQQIVIEQYMKKKLMFPLHLQISFYADYLESFASSCEQSVYNIAQFYNDFQWDSFELPTCYTPINSFELIRDKRLLILIWLTNEVCNQEVIGIVNLKLDCLERIPGENAMRGLIKDQKIIVANTLIGQIEGEFTFHITDGSKGRKQSHSEPNGRRRKTNNLIKLTRDHSV